MEEDDLARRDHVDGLTRVIIASAIAVHRELGPGLLESIYETCLAHELSARHLRVERQKALPITYRGAHLDAAYRIDLLVEDEVLVELKTVDMLLPLHASQLLSYLKLSKLHVGLLINFHVRLLKHGIRRFIR